MNKHTPGPWIIKRNPADCPMPFEISGQFHGETGHCGHVCNVFIHEDRRDSTELANARLIAAAPEMLEELQYLVDDCIEVVEREYADGTVYEVEQIEAYVQTVKRIRELIAKATGGAK